MTPLWLISLLLTVVMVFVMLRLTMGERGPWPIFSALCVVVAITNVFSAIQGVFYGEEGVRIRNMLRVRKVP